ncbi:hypothetical protein D9Q98_006262 [Chlorella vulgaris]|uniref:Carboxymuconolactone decarboxylase-like domain-containing protein n=1 Tax=Chlorella vulgaris TaxID=3077 RepID=A0A9D4TYD4_CHLVU|nr:hypothetical protein D9Q98_006262 [Chlorella vulgaris]
MHHSLAATCTLGVATLRRRSVGDLVTSWTSRPRPTNSYRASQPTGTAPAARCRPAYGVAGSGALDSSDSTTARAMDLSPLDRSMVRLYMAGCFHDWDQLPELAREFYVRGASIEQMRGCVRHMVVFAGYGPCLAATLALHKAKLLPEDTPAKVAGPPGDAFELVYGGVTDRVRANMHAADPALGEWIRLHLYGDLYSSPGLDMRQKQLLTCAFLAEANMPDQLFGHALAGLRFGNSYAALEQVARLACDMGPRPAAGRAAVFSTALKTLDMAHAKYLKDAVGQPPACPEVSIDAAHPQSVCIPPLPPLVNTSPHAAEEEQRQQQQRQQRQQRQQQQVSTAGFAASQARDASVSTTTGEQGAGLKAAGGGKTAGGWGTSNVGRPSNLAVDEIAARMEQQRARSGLFFNWDASAAQEEGGEVATVDMGTDGQATQEAVS